jgi:hypothetical protein
MALLWIEGFEGFGSSVGGAPSPSGIVSRKYPVISGESGFDIETGRDGVGYCIEIADYLSYLRSPNLTTNATCVLGVAVKINAHPSTQRDLLQLYENSNRGMNIKLNPDGTLTIENNVTDLGTTTSSLTINTWYYIEFKVLTNNTTGTAEIKVNGTSWLALTNQDTQPGTNAYHTAFQFQPPFGVTTLYDDVYFLDGSGSANNDFLGNRKVLALDPDSAGDTTQWTPSAGSNYQNVDDGALCDEDTTYNETSTSTDQDLYNYDALPSTVTQVHGLQINNETRVTAGSMQLASVIKTGTTTDVGSNDSITSTTYVSTQRVSEQDPDTASAWTKSGVDGAQFGIKAT